MWNESYTNEELQEMWKKVIEEMDIESKKTKKQIEQHLSKFEDIDKLFVEANSIIEEYYKSEDFNNIDEFKKYLKWLIKKYVDYFNFEWDFQEKLKLESELNFTDKYDKIIYFWQFNPIEERRKLLEQKEEDKVSDESEWVILNMRKWVDKLLNYFK